MVSRGPFCYIGGKLKAFNRKIHDKRYGKIHGKRHGVRWYQCNNMGKALDN